MFWKPPFYHYAFHFHGIAWYWNFFRLKQDTMETIREVKERLYDYNVEKIDNRFINILYKFEKYFARLSYKLFRISPKTERVIFWILLAIYWDLWRVLVDKFYVIHPDKTSRKNTS